MCFHWTFGINVKAFNFCNLSCLLEGLWLGCILWCMHCCKTWVSILHHLQVITVDLYCYAVSRNMYIFLLYFDSDMHTLGRGYPTCSIVSVSTTTYWLIKLWNCFWYCNLSVLALDNANLALLLHVLCVISSLRLMPCILCLRCKS